MYSYFSEARDVNQSICLQQGPSGAQGDRELNAIPQQFRGLLQAAKYKTKERGTERSKTDKMIDGKLEKHKKEVKKIRK
jgi:hypothetical protein